MEELKEIIKGKFSLLKDYSNGTFDKVKLREVSSILRFLFIDEGGAIQKIKNRLNLEDIKIKLNKNVFNDIPGTVFYQHGGGNKNGDIMIQSVQVINRALNLDEIKSMYESQKKLIEENKLLTLGQYLNSISFSSNGINISKEDLIIFSANKLGGNHYDKSREHDNKKTECKMIEFDNIVNSYKLLDENPIFIELMSIGQLLSKDDNLNGFINSL